MKIKASFRYNLTITPGNDCWIEKAVELSPDDFFQLQIGPLQEMPFITENKDCMFDDGSVKHCLLLLEQGGLDGVLIQSTGPDYPYYAAYISGMRDILNAELDRAAARIVQDAAEHTRDGNWRVSFDTLREQTGLNVQVGNGLDEMLLEKLAKREEVFSASLRSDRIEMICRLSHCAHPEENASRSLADLPPSRQAAVLENAVSSALGLYRGEDLYTMLHGCFGLTIQEIRDHGYLSNEEMTDICRVPQHMLEGGTTVRDLLGLEGLPEHASLAHRDSVFLVPVEDLKKLTAKGREDFASLLDARVCDIQVDDGAPEFLLEGVEAAELDRLHDELEAHEQAERAMGPAMG